MAVTYTMMFAAEERAHALLRSLLSADDLATWDQKHWLGPIIGSLGGLFAFSTLDNHLYYQVWELSPATGQELYRYCIVPIREGSLPFSDWIIGIMLLLQADEAEFRRIALMQWDHRDRI